MKKTVKSVINSVSAETVEKIITSQYLLACGLSVGAFISIYNNVLESIGLMASTTIPLFVSQKLNEIEFNTKDKIELAKSYQELLKKYLNLNKTFSLKNPVEIYTMFDFLVHNGYLSQNKTFKYSEEKHFDIYDLLGVDVIKGKAVCRHISTMLNDIYEYSNMKANTLEVASKIHTEEEFIDRCAITLEKYLPKDYEIENEYFKKALKELTKKDKIPSIGTDHLINLVVYKGKTHFLDPTSSIIFKKSNEFSDFLIWNNDQIYISDELYKNHNKRKETLLEEDEKTVKEVRNLCQNNLDIFENFYKGNCDLYDDILIKAQKVRM